jgi:pimeloyl-ACP methyl ester carboxylesterase
MTFLPDALWLSVSPALRGFNHPLLHAMSRSCLIGEWQYCQTVDEPNSLDPALVLLHDYVKQGDRPIHLIGHGISGSLALLYARRFPQWVRSLTLLSVGVNPAVDWQAHYYAQLEFLCCSRKMVLTQMVYGLLGYQSQPITQEFVQLLERDLATSLSPHTLYQRISIPPEGVPVPLLVCTSNDDIVVDPNQAQNWQSFMKAGDRLQIFPQGRYFFHYFYPLAVQQAILQFWQDCRFDCQYGCQPQRLDGMRFYV